LEEKKEEKDAEVEAVSKFSRQLSNNFSQNQFILTAKI
jgi:hypothetical protein